MSKLRENIISNCEKQFTLKCLSEFIRIDGRGFDEFRNLTIKLGQDWGCCCAILGNTRVIAQVSCEIEQPKPSRPSEGNLNINVELNPLAAAHFEAGRQTDLSVQLNRLLEKCLKDSKAVDLESLCIKVGEKAWSLRVDLNVLNHEGNILDCASIAALTALAHFRRPDVTTDGETITIHSYSQRDPIPTVMHHYPICVSYAVFDSGKTVLADPLLLEVEVAEAELMFGLNAYKELCSVHLGGSALLSPEVIINCTNKASIRACAIIQDIKRIIEEDTEKRKNAVSIDISQFMEDDTTFEQLELYMDKWDIQTSRKEKNKNFLENTQEIESTTPNSAILIPKESGQSAWVVSSDEDSPDAELKESISVDDSEEDVLNVNTEKSKIKR